jgi:serine protease Do
MTRIVTLRSRFLAAALLLITGAEAGAAPATPPATAPIRPVVVGALPSVAPLVDSLEPAVIAIEVEALGSGGDDDDVPPLYEEFARQRGGRDFEPRVEGGEGSGFIISADGLVLTNHHVVNRASLLFARFADGARVPLERVGGDADMDVALLRLRDSRAWPHVELGASAGVQVGDWVLAMGHPLGLGQTVTLGIVSGTGRMLGADAAFHADDFLQTDAAINEGNSGGPLFDMNGRVIGINTAIYSGKNTVGFAIPIDVVTAVLDDLRAAGVVRRPHLGARVADLPPLHAQDRPGAHVGGVEPGSPAELAGLARGDVIVDCGGKEIRVGDDLSRMLSRLRPGDRVALTVRRGEATVAVEVTLGERPEPGADTKARQGAPG